MLRNFIPSLLSGAPVLVKFMTLVVEAGKHSYGISESLFMKEIFMQFLKKILLVFHYDGSAVVDGVPMAREGSQIIVRVEEWERTRT